MRILGFIILGLLTIANLTMRRRLPPKNIAGGIFNIKAFRSPAFTIYCLSVIAGFLGVYSRKPNKCNISIENDEQRLFDTVLTFIAISAVSTGVDSNFAFYLVSIANAGAGIGRIITGFITGKTGKLHFVLN